MDDDGDVGETVAVTDAAEDVRMEEEVDRLWASNFLFSFRRDLICLRVSSWT